MLRLLIAILVFSFASSSFSQEQARAGLKHEQLTFNYQELLDPFGSYSCKHVEDGHAGMVLDWEVFCKVGNKLMVYAVHLVVSRYGKTRHGQSAYEVLYWVTDRSQERVRVYDSTTLWIHQNSASAQATVFELSQGIQNDLAALRLKIQM